MPENYLKAVRIHLAMSALILLLLAGCGVTLQSVERDKEQGRETARQVETDMGVYQDPGKAEYLNRVAGRLVAVQSEKSFTYQFAVVDQYEPNAFALPGGYVYVSRGFLALTNSEDELANVLAHEIIHVSRRHSAKQSAKATVPLLLARLSERTSNEWTIALTAVVNGLDPESRLTDGQPVKIAVSQPYGR